MSFPTRRAFAVHLLVVSAALLMGAAVPADPVITILPDNLTSPGTVVVKVDSADTFPVKVKLKIDGSTVDSGMVYAACDTVVLTVPAGYSGESWKITATDNDGNHTEQTGVLT